MAMNELKRLNFLNSRIACTFLKCTKIIQNWIIGKIQQFIESYLQIEDERFLQLTAVEEFHQAFELIKKRQSVSFLLLQIFEKRFAI